VTTLSNVARVMPTRPVPEARRYLDAGLWSGRLIDADLTASAERWPERTAIVDRDRRLDFAALDAAVDRVAAMLARLGVGRGDVVSFQLPNWLEAATVHHATARLGAVSNPIIPIYRGREVRFILGQARSRVFVVPDVFRRFDFRAMVADIRGELPDLEHVLVVGDAADGMVSFADAVAEGGAVPDVERSSTDVVLLLYTSGTEANPKGVLHSHDTLRHECQSIIDLYALTQDDRVLMPSPLTHITGLLYGLQLPLMLGTSVVLQDVWDVPTALELIEREGCRFMVGATPFLHGIVHAPELDAHDLSSLRVFGCGGADIAPSLIRAAISRLDTTASRLYGSTELPTVTGTPIDAPVDRHAETDGAPIGAAELRIVDEAGEELPPGARGELQARGPELCLGYLDPSLNDRAFTDDGWFRSGDLAIADEQGYIRIAGRAKDVILRGGENLSAKEIEDLLLEHPQVAEVAVVGYPDEVMGERTCAFVVAPGELSLDELVTFLRARKVANQKLPEHLRVVDELPRTASGKIQKYRLRDRLRAEVERAGA
jgi:non-ribosomal peptide synthetase component E (peptide arylation enzyme)